MSRKCKNKSTLGYKVAKMKTVKNKENTLKATIELTYEGNITVKKADFLVIGSRSQ